MTYVFFFSLEFMSTEGQFATPIILVKNATTQKLFIKQVKISCLEFGCPCKFANDLFIQKLQHFIIGTHRHPPTHTPSHTPSHTFSHRLCTNREIFILHKAAKFQLFYNVELG